MTRESRVLPFVLVDRVSVDRALDDGIVERERAEALVDITAKILDELNLDRIMRGEIDP